MPITNEEAWKEWVESNDDPYGKCCVDVARRVMEILDEEDTPLGPNDASDLINRADRDIKAGGITGFMAGAAAQMVSVCHSRGDEFRRSWNGDYGVADAEGVVNPAIVTINVPDGKTAEDVVTEAAEKAGYEVMDKDQVLEHFGIEEEKDE